MFESLLDQLWLKYESVLTQNFLIIDCFETIQLPLDNQMQNWQFFIGNHSMVKLFCPGEQLQNYAKISTYETVFPVHWHCVEIRLKFDTFYMI